MALGFDLTDEKCLVSNICNKDSSPGGIPGSGIISCVWDRIVLIGMSWDISSPMYSDGVGWQCVLIMENLEESYFTGFETLIWHPT